MALRLTRMDEPHAQPHAQIPPDMTLITNAEVESLRRKARTLNEIEGVIAGIVRHLPENQHRPIASISNSLMSVFWVLEDAIR